MKFREKEMVWSDPDYPNTGFANEWGYATIEDCQARVVWAENLAKQHKQCVEEMVELKEKNPHRYHLLTSNRRNRREQAEPNCKTCNGHGEVCSGDYTTHFCPTCWTT